MAEITLRNLGHSYLPGPKSEDDYALKPVDLVWEDGKTYALLGPSGCGKTTMLNIISGLLHPSDGQLLFDGQDVTHKGTSERNIAQVFQFPVIYTTKSVRRNLAFPLECRKWDPKKIAARVAEVSEMLDLDDILDMPARQLSADQKQLISLGRGLVRDDVSAVLLDEPLTVIDPQMKFALRRKLRQINRHTGTTMILVTHDQSEAMSFADEVVVMKDGRVQQSGRPEQLFERPENTFVGYFIGSPPINLFDVDVQHDNLHCPALALTGLRRGSFEEGALKIGVRPEHIRVTEPKGTGATAMVEACENLGIEQILSLRAANGELFKVKSRLRQKIAVGRPLAVSVAEKDVLVFQDGKLV
ncbi:ABC transporter ATP-binding protein [Cognatishimia sp. SS12]|uniref:ABC transporter ATP-binding protein n=1 Tax=Cognatishimia sp. SS12 TaxID=2979465 RepID=UPI00232E1E93|nr:ABC transporter ATP-binding protein [Cognatishimia sp. SS12]MDC0738319.1 ABC transporter ATP-binding protein [Cognatishimia sp. SS12]